MAHVAADRVKETTTTTGTGNITLAGASTGYVTFGSRMANNDTTYYCIAHQSANEWEVGYGTWLTGGTLARTTVLESSNAGAAVSLSAGTKDVFITLPGIGLSYGVLTVTPSTNQNDYAPTGFRYCNQLNLNIGATMKLTGLAGGFEGRQLEIANTSTDYLLWLENQNTASSAANRFDLPNGFPVFLMPGDHMHLAYDVTHSRWHVIGASFNVSQMGLTEFSDFAGSTAGPFTSTSSGTGAASAASTYLVNTTERVMGATQIHTGSTSTGRTTLGHASTDAIIPTLGAALSVARLAVETTVTGSQTFQVISGFADSAGGTFTDGVAWNNRWNGSAAEWSQDRLANTAATRSTTGSPTPNNNYIWLIVFVNPGWTRADFIYSEDSVSFTKADSPTTGLPDNTRNTAWVAASIIKSAGNTQRNVSIDLAGYRVDYVRG